VSFIYPLSFRSNEYNSVTNQDQ